MGIPAVSIVASGFVRQAKAVAAAMGIKDFKVAEYPGVIMNDGDETLNRKTMEHLVGPIVDGLVRRG